MKKTGRLSLIIAIAGLSACATTSSEYLMSGIDPASLSALGTTSSSMAGTSLADSIKAANRVKSTASIVSPDVTNQGAEVSEANAALSVTPEISAKQIKADTCDQFYKNAQVYLRASQQSVQNQVALAQMGVMILATVATGGVGGLGISSPTGQMLLQQVASTGVRLGGAYAINGINKKSGPVAKVIQTADELGCPVEFAKPAQQAP